MVITEKSLANLKGPTHEQAVERGMLGGKANITERGAWIHQKWCNKACAFYSRCPAISTSQGLEKVKGKSPCFIKKQPKEVQNYFESLFIDGEEGLIKVIMDLHFRLMLKTHSAKISARELKDAIETSLSVKKGIYGDKSKLELSGGITILQAPELRRILQEKLLEEDKTPP